VAGLQAAPCSASARACQRRIAPPWSEGMRVGVRQCLVCCHMALR
jgi:hypothetical protein